MRQRLTDPPPALSAINRRLAQHMGNAADSWGALAVAAERRDSDSYNKALAVLDAPSRVRNEWRLQVTAEARRLGVGMPAWARRVGTR
ncbi:MAG: hypothetical protein AB7I08_08685 [Thermoleophilia bacterium]